MKKNTTIKINPLSYRLLGVLVRGPISGYDIAKALEKFRPVKISQVYPALSDMESKGLLVSEEIEQTGKPNKKIYYTTELADEALRTWISDATEEPSVRDDFLAKFYALWKAFPDQRQQLLDERLAWLNSEIIFFEASLRKLHVDHGDLTDDPACWQFCRSNLFHRRLVLYREEVLWCHRILNKLGGASKTDAAQNKRDLP